MLRIQGPVGLPSVLARAGFCQNRLSLLGRRMIQAGRVEGRPGGSRRGERRNRARRNELDWKRGKTRGMEGRMGREGIRRMGRRMGRTGSGKVMAGRGNEPERKNSQEIEKKSADRLPSAPAIQRAGIQQRELFSSQQGNPGCRLQYPLGQRALWV